MMKSDWLLLSFLLCGIIATVNSSCYTSLSTAVSASTSYAKSMKFKTYTGLFDWVCTYRTKYSTHYKVTYSTGYKKVCCSGYGGSGCLPICTSSCGTNKVCSLPNTCTCSSGWSGSDCLTAICSPPCGTNNQCSSPPSNCICMEGWSGADCLTDIDECSMDTEVCEETCTNTNGSYSCSCVGDIILAKDNTTCLGGVQGIIVEAKQQSLFMSWSPPVNHTSDGVFVGYNVTCYGVVEAFVNDESYNLTSLDPFTDYKCCIEPYWSDNGVGLSVCKEMTTEQDAPSDSPHNITVIPADSESVLIQWSPPLIPNGIITHYNLYINYDTNGTNIHKRTVDSSSTLYLLEQLKVYQLIGVSVSATTGGGDGPQSLYTYGRSGETEPDGVHYLLIVVLSNNSVNVSWHPPALLKGVIIKYYLTIRNLTKSASDTMNEWTVDSEDVQYEIKGLQPFVPYEVEIAAATSIGKGDIVRRQYFTAESVPSVAPLWTIIERVFIATINLEWSALTLEESRGFITNYTIKYTESISGNSQLCGLTGNVFEVVLDANEILHLSLPEINPNAQYCVSIAASTAAGTGLFSQWNLVDVYKTVTVYFYINGIYNCDMWSQQNTRSKLQDFSNAVVIGIQNGCQCSITTNHVHKSTFLPCKDGLATIKLLLFQVDDYGANAIFSIVKEWVETIPVVTIDNLELEIVSACNNFHNCSRSLYDYQHKDHKKPEYIAPTIVGVVIVIVAMVIVITIVIRIKKKRSSRRCEYDMNLQQVQPNANPCYAAVTPGSRQLPSKPQLEPTKNNPQKLKSDLQGYSAKQGTIANNFGEGYIQYPIHDNSVKETDHLESLELTERDENDIDDDIKARDYFDPHTTIRDKIADLGTLPRGLSSSSGVHLTQPASPDEQDNPYEEI